MTRGSGNDKMKWLWLFIKLGCGLATNKQDLIINTDDSVVSSQWLKHYDFN